MPMKYLDYKEKYKLVFHQAR